VREEQGARLDVFDITQDHNQIFHRILQLFAKLPVDEENCSLAGFVSLLLCEQLAWLPRAPLTQRIQDYATILERRLDEISMHLSCEIFLESHLRPCLASVFRHFQLPSSHILKFRHMTPWFFTRNEFIEVPSTKSARAAQEYVISRLETLGNHVGYQAVAHQLAAYEQWLKSFPNYNDTHGEFYFELLQIFSRTGAPWHVLTKVAFIPVSAAAAQMHLHLAELALVHREPQDAKFFAEQVIEHYQSSIFRDHLVFAKAVLVHSKAALILEEPPSLALSGINHFLHALDSYATLQDRDGDFRRLCDLHVEYCLSTKEYSTALDVVSEMQCRILQQIFLESDNSANQVRLAVKSGSTPLLRIPPQPLLGFDHRRIKSRCLILQYFLLEGRVICIYATAESCGHFEFGNASSVIDLCNKLSTTEIDDLSSSADSRYYLQSSSECSNGYETSNSSSDTWRINDPLKKIIGDLAQATKIWKTRIMAVIKHLEIERVAVVPDMELHRFPFRLLLEDTPHYICQSLRLLNLNSEDKKIPISHFLGFLEKEKDYQDICFLRNGTAELLQYENSGPMHSIESLSKSEATIFHAVTHAQAPAADDDDSFIQFGRRVAKVEILKDDLSNKQLLILSACSSAITSSLGRSKTFGLPQWFFLARCRAIIGTMFAMEKVAGAVLIMKFYSLLFAGTGPNFVSRCLFEAQRWLSTASNDDLIDFWRTYSEDVPSDLERGENFKDPFFWACHSFLSISGDIVVSKVDDTWFLSHESLCSSSQ
jgi:hypothetical protein